jgi:hypothetical protein
MITLKEYLELIEYKINEGSDYGWDCYGQNTHMISAWNGIHGQGGFSFNCVFDTKDQTVYEVEVCDYTNDRAYRMINPDFKSAYDAEADDRSIGTNEAWDDVTYVDLDVDDDFFQKALAIRDGEDYDTRVQIEVDFDDAELLEYMKIAHDRDITFNELVEIALKEAIDQHRMMNDIHYTNTDNPIDFPVAHQKKKKAKK